MGLPANYRIARITDEYVYIEDVGPWTKYLTCTNDAEGVVQRLIKSRMLSPKQRLFVRDSNGDVDEYAIIGGKFAGFHVGRGLPDEKTPQG